MDELTNNYLNEVYNFLEDYSGKEPMGPNTDIFFDLGITGDDFHELIENYAKNYEVDMTNYLWYFHVNEEGSPGIGGFFFRPPYERVQRIPITPQLLAECIVSKKWNIEYPQHTLPKYRKDLWVNTFCFVVIVVLGLYFWLR